MKKVNYIIILFIVLTLGVVRVNASACNFKGGDGTEKNPYKITNAKELKGMECDMEAHYELANDIDLKGSNFKTIGYVQGEYGTNFVNFSGSFDGNNHVINNLSNGAMFLRNYGTIQNVVLKNVNIQYKGENETSTTIGSVAEENRGIVTNVKVDGLIKVEVGGSTEKEVTISIGGLVGEAGSTSKIENCINNMDIILIDNFVDVKTDIKGTHYDENVGGIVGENYGTIKNSYNTGEIKTQFGNEKNECYDKIGGIAGENSGEISYSYNTANIMGEWYVGGIAGISRESITNSYNIGNILGSGQVGGIAGEASEIMHNLYNTGKVRSTNSNKYFSVFAGGIVGHVAYYGCDMQNVYNMGDVSSVLEGRSHLIGNDAKYKFAYSLKKRNSSDDYSGTILTLAQMKDKNNFKGFDFVNVWKMGDENYPFPVLRGMTNKAVFENSTEPGDLNGNGEIDLPDVLSALKIYFGKIEVNDDYLNAGDINNNGKIDLSDVLTILKDYFKTV